MTSRIQRPFAWYGGKHYMLKAILPLLPEHEQYIEPFFGGGAVFFAKPPARVETINDLDGHVMNFWRALRDETDRFIHKAAFTPHSKELFEECLATYTTAADPVDRAWRWWVVARQSFSGSFGKSWRRDVNSSARGMSQAVSGMLGAVSDLHRVAKRLQQTQLEHRDGVDAMTLYCTDTSLCYCDPPYVIETRQEPRERYQTEMAVDEHETLVAALLELPGGFVVSGYQHPAYEPLEAAGWQRLDFERHAFAAARTRRSKGEPATPGRSPRIESVWLDPETAAGSRNAVAAETAGQATLEFEDGDPLDPKP